MARFKTSQPHFDSGFTHGELRIADTDFAEVENAWRQARQSALPSLMPSIRCLHIADAAGSDDGNVDRFADGAG